MKDIWIASGDEAVIRGICGGHQNVLGPMRGREATPVTSAAGDPALWYCCLRTNAVVELPEGCQEIAREEGIEVLGVWA